MVAKTVGTNNSWKWTEKDGFDLTRFSNALPRPAMPPTRIPLAPTNSPAIIDPAKTALVVIDLQNYFLSPFLSRPPDHPGLKAVDQLAKHAIPACRNAGIRIVWLSWGLTDSDVQNMPPSIARGFDFGPDPNLDGYTRNFGVLGSETDAKNLDGTTFRAGRVLCVDEWNTKLYPPLEVVSCPEDIHIKKNRPSGFWKAEGPEQVLHDQGITTLLFAGGSTEQSLSGSIQGACMQGWDCLMLSDACGTTGPPHLTDATKFQCENEWGFVLTCEQLFAGIRNMQMTTGFSN